MRNLFTSDLHFGHANIIEYCKRPFADVEEMDRGLIENWNAVVAPGDRVYVIGDFSFYKAKETQDILRQLRGNKFLVRGNHDKLKDSEYTAAGCFAWVKDYYELKVEDPAIGGTQRIVLFHYALRVWNKAHHGTWQLFGHSHGTLPDDKSTKSFDVGVDCHFYRPISYEDVKRMMSERGATPADGHRGDYR